MSLKDRCEKWIANFSSYAGDNPAEHLVSFIVTEIGRAADSRLDDTLPLALYFSCEQDRKEFIEAVMEAKPGMISKSWP